MRAPLCACVHGAGMHVAACCWAATLAARSSEHFSACRWQVRYYGLTAEGCADQAWDISQNHTMNDGKRVPAQQG